jgi:hypothetical protein
MNLTPRRRPAPTFGYALLRAAVKGMLVCATLFGAVGVAGITGHLPTPVDHSRLDVSPAITTTTPVEDAAADLIAAHGCKVEGYGSKVIPGHAVVTLPGQDPRYMGSGRAFRIVFGDDGVMGTGDEAPGRVHAFCL